MRDMSVCADTSGVREACKDEYVADLRAEGRGRCCRDGSSGLGVVRELLRLPYGAVGATADDESSMESVFSAVRLRTDAARRMKRRDSALYLVFKVALRLSERWRPLNGGRNLMGLLIDGARFEDGILAELPVSVEGAVAA